MFREKFPALTRILELVDGFPLVDASTCLTIMLGLRLRQVVPLRKFDSGSNWFSETESLTFNLHQSVKRADVELEGRTLPVAR